MPEDRNDRVSELDDFAAEQMSGEGVILSYVIIAEVFNDNGQEVRLVASDGMSPITALGMVTAAQGMIDLPFADD